MFRYGLASGMFFSVIAVIAEPLHLNQLQIIGSHNSYKKALPAPFVSYLQAHTEVDVDRIRYSHIPLQAQLDLGLRHLELDVVADPEGGLYSVPLLETLLNTELSSPLYTEQEKADLSRPGLKTLHQPDIDVTTHCVAFRQCLRQLKIWSDAHPSHLPVFVLINAKERGTDLLGAVTVPKFDAERFEEIDQSIYEELGRDKVFDPDTLRGQHRSLRDAVLDTGWPKLDAVRGQFIFIFDGAGDQNARYRSAHPSLKGRAMFAHYPETEDEAAILILNNPEQDYAQIRALIAKGYLVRTRADADITAPTSRLKAQFRAAEASGAQIISTDFYPTSPQSEVRNYTVSFSDGAFVKPPVTEDRDPR